MKVVGRGRTEEIRNKGIIIINLTVFLSVYAMWLSVMLLYCTLRLRLFLFDRIHSQITVLD